MRAEVNHGRWVVHCPSEYCHGAIWLREATNVVSVEVECDCVDQLVCDHPTVCGEVFVAEFPEERGEVERLLNLRPYRANRNWTPVETVEALKRENLMHGVAI